MLNESQRSRIQAVKMSDVKGTCGVNRVDGESNENVYRRLGMSSKREGMSCGVEMVKRNTWRWWSGHLERMDDNLQE